MKKTGRLLSAAALIAAALLANVNFASAREKTEDLGATLPIAYVIPFVCLLLCIAVMPLVAGAFWDKYKPVFVTVLSLAFLIPFAIQYGFGTMGEKLLESVIGDYLTFIVLLFGLFCVAGNIELAGDLEGKPKTNIIMLLIGTVLASWIGTTGASMVMIRPLIRANRWRKRKAHIMVFFIFLVSNIGGCLTPVGDPPLLMGFTRGVSFFWSLGHLWPMLLLNVVILLIVFAIFDSRAYKKDLADGLKPEEKSSEERASIRINGAHNIIFLVCIVGAVVLSGIFSNSSLKNSGIHIYGDVTLTIGQIVEVAIILIAALLSFKTTKQEVRTRNEFSWAAIEEVAVLFIGIFITMIPALLILHSKGPNLGLTKPWQMFWATGALSSFLDNTPTYLVFLTTAGALGEAGMKLAVGTVPMKMLEAISCGAVFMGANTYIGNAPNFMVKSISEESGIKMPSFFGYMGWSICILIPTFIIDTLVFFL